MSKMLALILSAAVAGAACGAEADGPPEIQVDRTACDHCRMLISEPRYAAAYRAPGAPARVFDDIGCLLAAVRREGSSPTRFWFHDATDGSWITGEPTLVRGSTMRTPMSGGIVAYRTPQAAAASLERDGGHIVSSVAELLASKDGGS